MECTDASQVCDNMDFVLSSSESGAFLPEPLTLVTSLEPVSEEAQTPSQVTTFQPLVAGQEYDYADKFPEGGRQAWATVFASFCMVFLTQGTIYSFGVFQDYYTRVYLNNHSPSKIAWIGSTQVFLVFFLGLPTGKAFDEGYLRPLLLTGSAIYIFSYFMLSFAKPHHFYQVFLAQGVGVGLGMGLIYVPAISICFHYFKRRRALAAGIASLGAAIGAIVQTIGLNQFFDGRVGFAWGIRIISFISLILFIIGNLLMRPRLPPRKLRKYNLPNPDVKKVATDVPFLVAIMASSLLIFAVYFPLFYVQLFAVLHGISTDLAFYSITIMNGATIIGRILMGILADKYGALNIVTGGSALLGIVSLTMIKATDQKGLVLFAFFYGILSGGCLSLGGPTVSAYVENISDLGFAFGYSSFLQSFFTLVAAPVAGQILDAPEYKWDRTTVVVSIIIFLGFFFLLVSRAMLLKRRRIWLV